MSKLYDIRREIQKLLLQDGLWEEGEVLIKRRTAIWNDVAVAVGASKFGQCLVVGVAKGTPSSKQNARSKRLLMDITIPITLVELPTVSDEEPSVYDTTDEDTRWEATVMRLLGDPLGRSADHYELVFDGFEDVDDEDYVIRQTLFKTTLYLSLA
jgi:hypothetical protein